jgi:hypothetical protein
VRGCLSETCCLSSLSLARTLTLSVSIVDLLLEFVYVFVSYMIARSAFLSLYIHTYDTHGPKKMYTHFNIGYLRTFSKLNRIEIYGVYCDILSKDGASYMNA